MTIQMKNKSYGIFSLLLAVTLVASCSVDESVIGGSTSEERLPQVSADVVSGELLVRFDSRVSGILESSGLVKSGVRSPMTRSGVLSVDEILDIVGGYEIERVFPIDSRTEDKAREAGLHLWYVVRFSDEHSVAKVAADLAKLGEVSRVDFNRTIKRADNQKAIPLTMDMLNSLASGAGNDPLYPLQWYLKNDASLNSHLKALDGTSSPVIKFRDGADIRAEGAWTKYPKGGHPSIIVAVIDEGVDVNHPDLKASMWVNPAERDGAAYKDDDMNGYEDDIHGYNFVKNNGKITVNDRNDSGHGTHVAGTIAARNGNDTGIKSIAGGDGSEDSGVRIMSCQIFSGMYAGTVLDEVRAIKYAADNGAVVLQCSWGYISSEANPYDWIPQFADDDQWATYNPLEKQALDYFVHTAGSPDGVIDGGIVVYAAGNESASASSYPGAYKDFIAVAAIAGDYTPAVYSNYGRGTTISAPGGDQDYYFEFGEGANMGAVGCILSTLPAWCTESEVGTLPGDFSGYGYMEGTSMACPQVSGVVALGLSYALEQRKHFKAQEFIELLYDSATDIEEYFVGEKLWYKYVTDLGTNHPSIINLDAYGKKMGAGLVNAEALLARIDGSDVPAMVFPNVRIALNARREIDPSVYFENGRTLTYTSGSDDPEIAEVTVVDGMVVIEAKGKGQTMAYVRAGDAVQNFVVTVNSNSGNGWL